MKKTVMVNEHFRSQIASEILSIKGESPALRKSLNYWNYARIMKIKTKWI